MTGQRDEEQEVAPLRLAYADPPYLGYAKFYRDLHPDALDYDNPASHRALIERLRDEFDGWALSLTSGNLHDILPMCPRTSRIGAWVKSFASFKPGVNPAYAWEPIIFHDVRRRTDRTELTVRDFIVEPITLKRGLVGAKPERVCQWILDMLGYRSGVDTLEDVFPGTGVMRRVLDRPTLTMGASA